MKKFLILFMLLSFLPLRALAYKPLIIELASFEKEQLKNILLKEREVVDFETKVENLSKALIGGPSVLFWVIETSPQVIYKKGYIQIGRSKGRSTVFLINAGYFASKEQARVAFLNKKCCATEGQIFASFQAGSWSGKTLGDDSCFRDIKSHDGIIVRPESSMSELVFVKNKVVVQILAIPNAPEGYVNYELAEQIAEKIATKIDAAGLDR